MWILIRIASLDPDLFWEYGFRIRIQDSQNYVLKNPEISSLKEHHIFCYRPDGFHLSLKVINQGKGICDYKMYIFSTLILVMENPGSESGSEIRIRIRKSKSIKN